MLENLGAVPRRSPIPIPIPPRPPSPSSEPDPESSSEEGGRGRGRHVLKNRNIPDVNFDKINWIFFNGAGQLYHDKHRGPSDHPEKKRMENDHPLGPPRADASDEEQEDLNEEGEGPLLPVHRNLERPGSMCCGLFSKCLGSPQSEDLAIGEGLKLRASDVELIESLRKNPKFGLPVGTLPFGTYDVMDIATCESLNFNSTSCKLKVQYDNNNPAGKLYNWKTLIQYLIVYIMASMVGIVGFIINQAIYWMARWKYEMMAVWMEKMYEMSAIVQMGFYIVGFNLLIMAFAAFMGYLEPISTGSGIPHIKAYFDGLNVPRLMAFKTLVTKAVGVVASVLGGMPVVSFKSTNVHLYFMRICLSHKNIFQGKEGPMIHSGAIIGEGISQAKMSSRFCNKYLKKFLTFTGLDKVVQLFRNEEDKQDFTCCGAAADVSAAFGAPIGAIFFIFEEGASINKVPLLFLLLVSSTASFLALNIMQTLTSAEEWKTGSYAGFLSFGSFNYSDWDMTQLGIFVIIGIIGGVSGALFNKLNAMLTQWRMRHLNKDAWKRFAEIMIWTVVVSGTAIFMIIKVSDCQDEDEIDPYQRIKLDCEDGKVHGGASICK